MRIALLFSLLFLSVGCDLSIVNQPIETQNAQAFMMAREIVSADEDETEYVASEAEKDLSGFQDCPTDSEILPQPIGQH